MIVTHGLTKRYGKTLAVDGLSFTVTPGVVTGFLGPNGSGKSTTMRMIMGLDVPDAGSATVNGLLFDELRWPLREVGALLDAKAFHPGRTARNHLRWLAQTNDLPLSRIDEVLDIVGLTSVADKRAGKFSLGMGQRLGIASALLGDPGVLLFDEPVNGLDPEGIRWVRHLLRGLAAEGRTVLVSSHLISEMALTAERLVVIGRGTLIAETSVEDFAARYQSETVRVVTPTPQLMVSALSRAGIRPSVADDGAIVVEGVASAQVGEVASQASLTLHELMPVRASLEDAFMELTSDAVEYRSHDDIHPHTSDNGREPAIPAGAH
jgi:ABC-2 type transport system ATP-binding protein